MKKNILLKIFITICVVTLVFSICKIIKWKLESDKVNNEANKLTDISDIKEIDEGEIVNTEDIPESNPYWDYIKMKLINVDFEKLKKENSDTVGWIQVGGTNINYPFVQTNDNDYYLKHSFDKSRNSAGWVFLDYRNNLLSEDKNTIIYAHGRMDTIMFGSLINVLTNGWLNNKNNHIVKLSTQKENTLWQVFSVYHIPTTNDYLYINFNNNQEFLNFGNMLKDRSAYDFNTNINENDKILTLSTCYSKTDKMVLHAKLIKREIR